MDVHVVDHPLAKARLSTMRDARTDSAAFRSALHELTMMLVYEATREAPVCVERIHTPVARTDGHRLANPPLLVPVLRAGLGMADQAHKLIPDAKMGFVGLARDEQTLQPTPYMESLPENLSECPVLVLDPMLATGGSREYTIRLRTTTGALAMHVVKPALTAGGLHHVGQRRQRRHGILAALLVRLETRHDVGEHDRVQVRVGQCAVPVGQAQLDQVLAGVLGARHRPQP